MAGHADSSRPCQRLGPDGTTVYPQVPSFCIPSEVEQHLEPRNGSRRVNEHRFKRQVMTSNDPPGLCPARLRLSEALLSMMIRTFVREEPCSVLVADLIFFGTHRHPMISSSTARCRNHPVAIGGYLSKAGVDPHSMSLGGAHPPVHGFLRPRSLMIFSRREASLLSHLWLTTLCFQQEPC
jgi:hypothetical protein